MNYSVNHYDWTDMWGNVHSDWLPDFIIKAKWGCNIDHIIDKWKYCEDSQNTYGRMNRFYAELDNGNRHALIDWMMENYHE